MRLNPLDIRQQQFTVRRFRGLDSQEVEAFLEDVADDYESILKENALLKEQLDLLEQRARNFADQEKTLQETLVTSHRITEEMKVAAKRDAQLLLREAELDRERYLDAARAEEAKIRTDVSELKRLRHQLMEDLRATILRYEPLLVNDLRTTLSRYERMLTGEGDAEPDAQG